MSAVFSKDSLSSCLWSVSGCITGPKRFSEPRLNILNVTNSKSLFFRYGGVPVDACQLWRASEIVPQCKRRNVQVVKAEAEDDSDMSTPSNGNAASSSLDDIFGASLLSPVLELPPGEPSQSGSNQTTPTTSGATSSDGHSRGGAAGRSGLHRTPISGSVQSATSAHDLPHPAVAVRNLIEQARYAHLCTIMSRMHHRRRGYPFGSLVDFAPDQFGHPIFSLSPLAIHTRNLLADPRCTLVVQMPGWSGLANARVTIFGDVYPLPREQQEWARQLYAEKHNHGTSQQWGNFYFYRMDHISDIYFVGGFGTVAWVNVDEYRLAHPDLIAANKSEHTLQELNGRFSKELCAMLARANEAENKPTVDDAALISIDSKGVDVRVRQGTQFNVQRMSFHEAKTVDSLDQAMTALRRILDKEL